MYLEQLPEVGSLVTEDKYIFEVQETLLNLESGVTIIQLVDSVSNEEYELANIVSALSLKGWKNVKQHDFNA